MTDRSKIFLHQIIILILLFLSTWLFVKYIISFIAPFILAFIISLLLECPVKTAVKFLHIPRRFASLVCISLLYILVFFLLKNIVSNFFIQLHQLLAVLPDASVISENITRSFSSFINRFFGKYSTDMQSYIKNLLARLISGGISVPVHLRNSIISMTSAVPDIFIFTLTTVISSYFLSSDLPHIYNFIHQKLPFSLMEQINNIKRIIVNTVIRYIRALAILSTITFFELLIGFTLLKIPQAFIAAFLTSCIDALPVFGCGFVLIPWTLFSLIRGTHKLSIGLSVIYLITTITHNALEPKIVGSQTGLHPLISLASVYVGVRLLGPYGLFSPLIISFALQILRLHNNAAAVSKKH